MEKVQFGCRRGRRRRNSEAGQPKTHIVEVEEVCCLKGSKSCSQVTTSDILHVVLLLLLLAVLLLEVGGGTTTDCFTLLAANRMPTRSPYTCNITPSPAPLALEHHILLLCTNISSLSLLQEQQWENNSTSQ